MQDIVHDYLLEQTEKFEANHSTAVLMEVNTGKLKLYQISLEPTRESIMRSLIML